MVLRFVQISSEERPCGTGAVDLVKYGRTRTAHPVSVAGVDCDVEGEMARPASEFLPTSSTAGPTGLNSGEEPGGESRVAMGERTQ